MADSPSLFLLVLPDWVFLVWLVAFVCIPLILWALSGVSVRDKWMSGGDD